MTSFMFRLWTHAAEDGILPHVTVHAETKMEAAALALQHFRSMNCVLDDGSYLESEPGDGRHLRVRHVLDWFETEEGQRFRTEQSRGRKTAMVGAAPPSRSLSPHPLDLLVRIQRNQDGTLAVPRAFVIVEAVTHAPVMGPFASKDAAIAVAQSLAATRSRDVWFEEDEALRQLGPMNAGGGGEHRFPTDGRR